MCQSAGGAKVVVFSVRPGARPAAFTRTTGNSLARNAAIRRTARPIVSPAGGTIGCGYNSLRFDDEVTRFLLWRNLADPYAREWRNGCSRWDLLDAVRCCWALRPQGIAWPQHADGRPSFKLEDLARAIGLDPHRLVATVREYNAGQASGRDAFGRQHMPAPIGTGPFHAIRQQGASVTSTVGLAVDGDLRVIRADGSAVPNLYAAGEILGSGQTQGFAFVGGMMAMPALVFGRLLGQRLIPF